MISREILRSHNNLEAVIPGYRSATMSTSQNKAVAIPSQGLDPWTLWLTGEQQKAMLH